MTECQTAEASEKAEIVERDESRDYDLERRIGTGDIEAELDINPDEKRDNLYERANSSARERSKKNYAKDIEKEEISSRLTEHRAPTYEDGVVDVDGTGSLMRISSEHRERVQPADTGDGSVVIPFWIDEETGKVYLSFERKSKTHPSAGKLALYGGHVRVGETYFDALPRELTEEDPEGGYIVLKALKDNKYNLEDALYDANGVPSRTQIRATQLRDPSDIEKYVSSKTTEGDKTVLSLEETVEAMRKNSFAFPEQQKAVAELIERIMSYPQILIKNQTIS